MRSSLGSCAKRILGRDGGLLAMLGLLVGCGGGGMPSGLAPVTGFQLDRYLGTWYEIARLDHSFERGLTHVGATYSLNEDGTVRVVNRGYDPAKREWREAVGRAKFVGDPATGQLKVSFFGPFYGGYNIISLDPDYGHAVVCGPTRGYFWILAREPRLPPEVLTGLVEQAKSWNFAAAELIFVQQDNPPPAEP
mgnify:CR=1 FL=1